MAAYRAANPEDEVEKLDIWGETLPNLDEDVWNFGIPYRLKQLIDLVSHKDILFSFDGTGFQGLLKARKAAVVYARGLDYQSDGSSTPARKVDFQKPYVEAWLRLIGIAEIVDVIVEKTLFGRDVDIDGRTRAKQCAVALAGRF